MKIRQKLTLQFFLMAGIIMVLFSLTVYYLSARYRHDDFFQRLESRANSTARLLIEVEEIDAELLRKIEEDNPVSLPDEKIIILDNNNNVVYTTDPRNVILYDEALLDRIRIDGKVRTRSGRYELMGVLFAEEEERFVVLSAARDIFGFDKQKNLRMVLLLLNGIFLLLYYPAGWLLAARAFSPISRVVEKVEDISITSLNLRLEEGNGKDELAHLAHTFNLMLERLETAFAVQKDFISNASHELRTPLTAITGQLDVLLMKKRSTEEYRNATVAVLEDIKNLNRLIDRLLLKYESGYTVTISLDETISDMENMVVMGDDQLLRSAVTNIMENGCKYSPDKSVDADLSFSGNRLSIKFKDRGPGIAEADIERIFEPFYRGMVAGKVKGHGIGLSLAKKIIEIHQGDIAVVSFTGIGTEITVSLPSAPPRQM